MDQIIHVRDLRKSYGKIRAIDKISLDIPEGVVALIGPNGSGKTTFVNILMGLVKPDAGEVTLFGSSPWTHGGKIGQFVSALHEKPRFPPWYTGLEYLSHVASLYGTSNREDKIREIATKVGIEESLERRIGEYSAGMVQRLGLAQVFIADPRLAILDEPTANLDPKARIEVLNLIKELRRDRGMSFILSSHILSELERACDFVVFLYCGRLLLASDTRSLSRSSSVLEYKVSTSDNRLLFEKARDAGLKSVELSEGGVFLKAENPREVTRFFQLIVDNELIIEYVEPARNLLENVYLSMLEKKSDS